jgi:peptide/nickel transport system substrate-binding protein
MPGSRRAVCKFAAQFFSVVVLAGGLAAAATAEEPRKGGTLVYGVIGDPPTIDCHAASSFATMHYVSPHYSLLIKLDPHDTTRVVGDLAESWTESADKLTYTFKLKPNVKFHDGTPLTSADVKASWDRIRKPPEGVISVRASVYSRIEAIDTPDAMTAIFRLKTASPAFLGIMASPFNCIYSAARLAQDPNFPAKEIVGTGPFVFVERVRGAHWVGRRFDGYFDQPRPYLDDFRAINTSAPSVVSALQSGQIMAQFRTLAPSQVDQLKTALGDRIQFSSTAYSFMILVAFNTRKAPYDDARVRRALSLAIDRWGGAQSLSKVSSLMFVGATQRPGSPWAAADEELGAYPGFSKDIAASREEAKKLLREAGQENLSLKLVNRNITDPYTSAGVYLVDQWRQIGVKAEHVQLDVGQLMTSMRGGAFDVIIDFVGGEAMDDPSIELGRFVSADVSSYNPSGFIDRTVDQLYAKVDSSFDVAERKKLLRQLEGRLLTEAYQVPFMWLNRTVGLDSKVRGFVISPSHFVNQDLATIWLAQ